VGDAAAIPILSAILETFPSSAKGVCVIEIPTKEDEQILETNADIEFIWLYNKHPEMDRFGYVACEFFGYRRNQKLPKKRTWLDIRRALCVFILERVEWQKTNL